ncbi:MAG: DUF4145 domain-containing protein [Armatimonadetes bacterium]|nr:DUF4145 domain-containing protein [Armatimonadota bacterium]NIM23798.1 DUF4145 domain-containing protein [Armatimonadota bacterium]NIM67675.1 DUF4145 domain-containing protein [Armatimonadota bacterium]NIN05876.1 DUF4145 domain-containing protein [Armatimonadota bacterium]NIO97245.1 DUF4145 domain-containing protein [Armatimonadota bacterium]
MTDGTRGYIEKAAYQINGCYEAGFYDACAIMIRRLVETLIIEVFEKIGKADIIKGTDGNFFMLPCLLDKLSAEESINLGREAKRVPGKIKKFGDRSAHNRRWNATKSDLDSLKDDTRLLVEELIHLSGLQ